MKSLVLLIVLLFLAACSRPPLDSTPATSNGQIIEVVFGDSATLVGTIEQIKTYNNEGQAVFPYYLYTESAIVVRSIGEFDPGETDKRMDGMEVVMLEGSSSQLEQFRGKRVSVRGHVSGDLHFHCFPFGLLVSSTSDISTQ